MSVVNKYTHKPTQVEAVQWVGDNYREVAQFVTSDPYHELGRNGDRVLISTMPDGPGGLAQRFAFIGDWIIKGVNGWFYPCAPDVFEASYRAKTPIVFDNEDGQWFGAKADFSEPLDFTKAIEELLDDAFSEYDHNAYSAALLVLTVRMRSATKEEAARMDCDPDEASVFCKADEVGEEYWSIDTNALPFRAR